MEARLGRADEKFDATLAKLRRQDEAIRVIGIESDAKAARARRRYGKRYGECPQEYEADALLREHALFIQKLGITPASDLPFIDEWRRHINTLARDLKVEIVWADTRGVNAYAWQRSRRIELGAIIDVNGYSTGLHELGHCVEQCRPEHVRKTIREKPLKQVCCECELAATRWAAQVARPYFTKAMHTHLAEALRTYRKHATGRVGEEMDYTSSYAFFADARLKRLRES